MASSTPHPPEYLTDSDWSKRHHAISLRKLMYLKTVPDKPDTFLSTSAAFPPTPAPRAYGGHVFAQSAWAAAHTVPFGLHVNSVTGYFLLIGNTHYAFEYRVRRVRDGGVYCLRQVEAFQNSKEGDFGKTPVFIAFVSFKRDERGKHRPGARGQRKDFQHQELLPDYLMEEYSRVLGRKGRFEEWPLCQGMDGIFPAGAMSLEKWKQRGNAYPGLEMRKVDMTGYNVKAVAGAIDDNGEAARKWRLLILYRIVLDEEEEMQHVKELAAEGKRKKTGADDVLNLHAIGHLYASDRNSLFLAQRALGFEKQLGQVGSLSHTVNFHTHASALSMVDTKVGRRKEYAQEAWCSNSGADRVCHNSRLWDVETGQILASTVQDGMMRMPVDWNGEIIDGDAILRKDAKL
ncbi:hypothetical protein LTR05_004440 [Lithohypha guttulata]|uniref:Acyl-CoA thioesterase-like N-terminal HotDog domain-containing protein n=1 Tax=Lithohypha guttulata TaxID=1690604 RepID=A0AAN7SYM1_9EURO|nr:hypothetical protein LTR05_004440 [Lithohypha guttulata]